MYVEWRQLVSTRLADRSRILQAAMQKREALVLHAEKWKQVFKELVRRSIKQFQVAAQLPLREIL